MSEIPPHPVFPDSPSLLKDIGYCNVGCYRYEWHSEKGEQVRCLWRDNGGICRVWVKDLVEKNTRTMEDLQKASDTIRTLQDYVKVQEEQIFALKALADKTQEPNHV